MIDPNEPIRLSQIRAIPDMTIGENGQPTHSWVPVNLAELDDQPPVKPTLGNVGFIYPGKRHVLSGPQESAKTLAAYAIALQVVRQGGTVIIIDFEMGRWDARNRLRDLGATDQELAEIAYFEPAEAATDTYIQGLLWLKPQLVIIDAAAGAYDNQGLDDNKRADVEKFTKAYITAFWQAQIATIVLDHVVKNTDNRGSYAIGSERKVGGTDVHLGFEAITPIKRGGTGTYKITTHKDRGGYLKRGKLAELHLSSDPETHRITWEFENAKDDEPFRPTVLMERVSAWLQQQDEPHSFTQIKDNVKGEDGFIGTALERLIEEGYATEQPGPRDARLVSHTSLFTGQPAPLRPSIHADQDPENDVTSPKQPKTTPADPCVTPARRTPTTPASPSMDAGVAGDDEPLTPASQINVYDEQVQALLDDRDSDIPF